MEIVAVSTDTDPEFDVTVEALDGSGDYVPTSFTLRNPVTFGVFVAYDTEWLYGRAVEKAVLVLVDGALAGDVGVEEAVVAAADRYFSDGSWVAANVRHQDENGWRRGPITVGQVRLPISGIRGTVERWGAENQSDEDLVENALQRIDVVASGLVSDEARAAAALEIAAGMLSIVLLRGEKRRTVEKETVVDALRTFFVEDRFTDTLTIRVKPYDPWSSTPPVELDPLFGDDPPLEKGPF